MRDVSPAEPGASLERLNVMEDRRLHRVQTDDVHGQHLQRAATRRVFAALLPVVDDRRLAGRSITSIEAEVGEALATKASALIVDRPP